MGEAAIDFSTVFTREQVKILNQAFNQNRERVRENEKGAQKERQGEVVTSDFLRAEMSETRADLRSEIAQIKTELKSEIAQVEAALKSEISHVEAALRSEIAEVRADMKADRSEIKADLRTEISAVKDELRNEMHKNSRSLIQWMVGLVLTSLFGTLGLMKILFFS